MFSPGDVVVYRHHVCTLAAIREAYFEGKDYLELHALFEKSLKLFVAIDEAEPPTLRPTMTRIEALALIDSIVDVKPIDEESLGQSTDAPTLIDRRMKEEYIKHLRAFTPEELIPIMKSVVERTARRSDVGRHITATDKRYFDLAENLLCDELAVSLDIDRNAVKEFMLERIRQSETQKR